MEGRPSAGPRSCGSQRLSSGGPKGYQQEDQRDSSYRKTEARTLSQSAGSDLTSNGTAADEAMAATTSE